MKVCHLMFLQALYRDVLEGSCVGEARDQAKPRFSYPRSYAVDEGECSSGA
jgi:hypothetical protein